MMENNKKELKKWIILIIVAIIAHWAINNLSTIGNLLSSVISIIFPFVLGGAFAFVLNIPMSFFEKKLLKPKKKKSRKVKTKKTTRIISIILAIAVITLILALILKLIVPELINVVNLLIANIPYYIEEITNLVEEYAKNMPDIDNIMQEINENKEEISNQILTKIPGILISSISLVNGVISGITTFFIAIIFAIYILMDKEKLQEQATKVLYAYLSKEKALKIIHIGRVTKNTFRSFFTVQCLEATILGTLCTIGMLILKLPYAMPIGVLIGVTALIPVVGAFIGIIVGAILILSINPFKVITFVIFVLILQQVEGNLIYPRVVGNSIGLPGMWVLVAVSVGGSLGGIIGMLLGVPIATIVYTLLKKDVDRKINKKETRK